MPTTKAKTTLLDRLLGKTSGHLRTKQSAVSATLDLRRAEMATAARFRLLQIAIRLASNESVDVDDAAVAMAEADIDQQQLDSIVGQLRARKSASTYRQLAERSFQWSREAMLDAHAERERRAKAIADYDRSIKALEASRMKHHGDGRDMLAQAELAEQPIPLVEQIVSGVRDENHRLRQRAGSIEDQYNAAKAMAEGVAGPIAEHLAAFAAHVQQTANIGGVGPAQAEARIDTIATVLEDLKAKTIADLDAQKIDGWAGPGEGWHDKPKRIERAQLEVRVFLRWLHEQGRVDAHIVAGERPNPQALATRVSTLEAALAEAESDLAASDELLAQVEAEASKAFPFGESGLIA